MKPIIFIDPGHSTIDPGAVGYETEFRLAEAVSKHQADYLKAHYVCEPYICPSSIDGLPQICKMANEMGASLFTSNHFNAGKGDGYEALVYSQARVPLGKIFEKHVTTVGQNSRGVKLRPDLYVLKHTAMPAILNEGAFVDNLKDIQDWNEDTELKHLGEAYAKASAEFLGLERKRQEEYSLDKFIRDVQAATGSMVDGKAGPQTLRNTVTVSAQKNYKHPVVKCIQQRLMQLGYRIVGTADGIAGAKFTAAVVDFQRDNGCWADGEITAKNKTWRKLLEME